MGDVLVQTSRANSSLNGLTLSFTASPVMVTVVCAQCGVLFAITKEHEQALRDLGETGSFYCPNGHSLVYGGLSEGAAARTSARQHRGDDAHRVGERRAGPRCRCPRTATTRCDKGSTDQASAAHRQRRLPLLPAVLRQRAPAHRGSAPRVGCGERCCARVLVTSPVGSSPVGRETTKGAAHPRCQTNAGHVCQEPSGRTCIEAGCNEAAGTKWGPLWCPEHDQQRLNGISAMLNGIAAEMRSSS